jgi:hypothetical protein
VRSQRAIPLHLHVPMPNGRRSRSSPISGGTFLSNPLVSVLSFLARPIRGLRRNESAVACGCEGGFTWERDRSLFVRWVGPSRYLSALTDLSELSELSDLSALSALYSLSACRAYGPILFFGSFPNPPTHQFIVYFSHLLHGDGRTSEAKPDYAEVVALVRGSEGGSGPKTIPFHSVGINLDSPHRYPSHPATHPVACFEPGACKA